MNDDTVTIWHERSPMLIFSEIAALYNLTNGTQITDKSLYTQILEANTNYSRAACNWQPGVEGECTVCSA